MEEKIEYTDTINYVVTTQPDIVAGYIDELNERIAEIEQELAKYKELQDQLGLENADEFEWFAMLDLLTDNEKNMHILDLHRELAELKEKAIIPKFKVGQEVWHIITAKPMRDFIVRNDMHQYELGISKFGVYEDFLFATEQEAQDKLKEIQGNE